MPSRSQKQRRFMGAKLAEQRKKGSNSTGMSEGQLSDFASEVKVHGSLEDITYMENDAECKTVDDAFVHPLHKGYGKGGDSVLKSYGAITWGALDPPAVDGEAPQFTPGSQSCNRDAGQSIHYGAEVVYSGPDTDYRAEEIDPHQYGRSYEPYPLRDYFKTDDKQEERTFRLREQDEYDEFPTPGTVQDKGLESSEAYGAIAFTRIDTGNKDNRSFDSQRKYSRGVTKAPEFDAQVKGIDQKKGSKIR